MPAGNSTIRPPTQSTGEAASMTSQETEFAALRWPDTNGRPVCPNCGCQIVYDCRKANGAPRWRCKACRKDFSLTSGTIFAQHKIPIGDLLKILNAALTSDRSILRRSAEIGHTYQTNYVAAQKVRFAVAGSRGTPDEAARDALRPQISPMRGYWQSRAMP